MRCPYCGFAESKVIDSRPTEDGGKIRRRRECLACGRRFTTYEVIEMLPITVIKKNRTREMFSRAKLLNGLMHACEKRPVSMQQLERIVDDIEIQIQNSIEREMTSDEIGRLALERLRKLDQVAYIRFASVYREFKDVDSFLDELRILKNEK